MNRKKKLLDNIKSGTFLAITIALVQFICRAVMLRTIGKRFVGLDGVFISLVGVLGLTELGIGSAINYSLYEPVANKDYKKANKIIAFYRELYGIIGIATLFIGLLIIPALRYIIIDDISDIKNFFVLYFLVIVNSSIGYFLFAYKQSIFVSNLMAKEVTDIKSFTLIIQCLLQILSLLWFHSYLFYLIISIIMTITNNLLCSHKAHEKFPEYYASGELSKEEKINILVNVKSLFIQKIGNTVWNSADSLVISAFLGLNMVAIYNNYYYIMRFVFMILGAIETALIPTTGNSIVTESKEKNISDFYNANFIYMWLLSLSTACYCAGVQVIIKFWAGTNMMLSSNIIILLGLYCYTSKMGSICYVYKEALGIWIKGQYIPLISAILNIIMNIILTKAIGISGILISSIISMGTINLIGYVYILFKEYLGNRNALIRYLIKNYMYAIYNLFCVFIILYILSLIAVNSICSFIVLELLAFIMQNIFMLFLYFKTNEFKKTVQMIDEFFKVII